MGCIATGLVCALVLFVLWITREPSRSARPNITNPEAKKPRGWHPPGQGYQPTAGGKGEPKSPPSEE